MPRVRYLLLAIALLGCEGKPELAVAGVTATSGGVEVQLSGTEGHFFKQCQNDPWLGLLDGGTFRFEGPSCGSGEPYFRDGTYFGNEWWLRQSCVCDYSTCTALQPSYRFATVEALQSGHARRPDDAGEAISLIGTPTAGPWLLHLTTMADERCESDAGEFVLVIAAP